MEENRGKLGIGIHQELDSHTGMEKKRSSRIRGIPSRSQTS